MRLDPRAPRKTFSESKNFLNPRPRSGRAQRDCSRFTVSSGKTESSAERPSGNFSSRHPEVGLRTAGWKDVSPGVLQDAVRPTSGNQLPEGRVRTATG